MLPRCPGASRWVPAAGLALLVALPARAGTNRFWLATQHDWGARRGFYLNFENSSQGAAPCKLETLSLILGVADGKEWRYLSHPVAWQVGHDYVARAVIGPKGAELWLDGQRGPGDAAPLLRGPLLRLRLPDAEGAQPEPPLPRLLDRAGLVENEEDWRIAARHCDVIGYDRYAPMFLDERLERLLRETDKPALCGEFSFPAWYDGERGYGLYGTWVRDDAHGGELYERWVADAARNPYCVGLAWFQYPDQPLTGRGPGRGPRLVHGEHYAFGVVDVTDRPKWDLVRRMRTANLRAAKQRQEAAGG